MHFVKKIALASYSLRMKFSKISGVGIHIRSNTSDKSAPVSFYSINATDNSGEQIGFQKYKGRKVLLVNLASECGYTPQLAELEQLHQKNKHVAILGFPSNNFGEQEPGSDEEIFKFCSLKYGVTFPIFKKNDVKGINKQDVYKWLSNKDKNGWNNKEPKWNFYKYLVDENGNLLKMFSSSVSPLDIKL